MTTEPFTRAVVVESALRRLLPVLGQVNSTLHGSNVSVVTANMSAPAMSRNSDVFLNKSLDVTTVEGMIIALGLNYHELAHVMFTRSASGIASMHYGSYNALEDQRIENIIIGMFPNTKNYLTASAAAYLNPASDGTFPLLWGRKYLPASVRHTSRRMYRASKKAQGETDIHDARIAEIIDEYIRFSDPMSGATKARATSLVREYFRLTQGTHSAGCASDPGESSPGASGGEVPDFVESEIASDESSDANASSEDGSHREVTDESREAMASAVDEAIEKASKQEDFADVQKSVRGSGLGAGKTTEIGDRRPVSYPVSEEMKLISKRIEQKFLQLVIDNDPGWEIGNASGKVSMGRVIRGDSLDTVFDSWKEGRQDTGNFEVAILMDVSGSTNAAIVDYNKAMWIMRRAIESLPGDVHVRARYFNGVSYEAPNEPVSREEHHHFPSGGGTNPRIALEQTFDDMIRSNRSNKLVVIITDGGWLGGEEETGRCDAIIRNLNDQRVVTALMNVSPYSVDLEDHCARYVYNMKRPDEMIGMVSSIVQGMIKESK